MASFIPCVEVVACETTRGRDPPDNLEEVDVDDVVDDVDGGIGDRADRPNAGEGELNRIPLSLSSAYRGEGQKRSDGQHAMHRRIYHLLIPLR